MEKKNSGFFEAPPQTMFVFGIVVGIAVTLLAQTILGGAPTDGNRASINSGSGNVAERAPSPSPTPAPGPSGTVPPVTDEDYVLGNTDAPVTIIEYSDYECPFCARFHPTIKNVLADYADEVQFVYRHFPLQSIHPNAERAAVAAECIGEQTGAEGFYAFNDIAFEDPNVEFTASGLSEAASQIRGVNINEFETCLSENRYIEKVRAQQQGGVSAGVTGTPGTFINGQLVSGAVPESNLRQIIDGILAQ